MNLFSESSSFMLKINCFDFKIKKSRRCVLLTLMLLSCSSKVSIRTWLFAGSAPANTDIESVNNLSLRFVVFVTKFTRLSRFSEWLK